MDLRQVGGEYYCAAAFYLFPCFVIVLVGIFTRQKLVKSLDAACVRSSIGQIFLWENLYCIDHVSKHFRSGGVARKIEDNQLEFVFAEGKTIIPPFIHNREGIWNLVNSIPVQVKFDGEIKSAVAVNNASPITNEDFLRMLSELPSQDKENK